MTVTIRVVGEAGRRGIIPRVPSGERLVREVEAWLRADDDVVVLRLDSHRRGDGPTRLSAVLHPAAPPVVLAADDAGRVVVTAQTDWVGPGYHTFVLRLLERLGANQSISWLTADPEDAAVALDDPARIERPAVERAHLVALRAALAHAQATRATGAGGLQVGLPASTRFTFDAALASPLGPRDDAWLEAAVANPSLAIDIRPWWQDATDGRYLLNRALVLLWSEVRWRVPATDDERRTVDEALRLLRRAYPLDPSLPFPWREWKELRDLRGGAEPMLAQIEERAARDDRDAPRIGYRRQPVGIVHEGWTIEVPGSFAERRTDEEWWGGEAGRRITIAAITTDDGGRPMRPHDFLDRVAADRAGDALQHADGAVVGRARLDTDASSGMSVGVLEGFSAVVGSGAAIRVEFDDPADWQWAVDRWRALRPAEPAAVPAAGRLSRRP